jgi:hypothetical protein
LSLQTLSYNQIEVNIVSGTELTNRMDDDISLQVSPVNQRDPLSSHMLTRLPPFWKTPAEKSLVRTS